MGQMTEDMIRQIDALQRRLDGLVKPEIPLSAGIRPLFSAHNSASDADVTGDGTTHTVICDTEIFDINSNYNNATGIFTAPVTGKYIIFAQTVVFDLAGTNTGRIIINSSNRAYNGALCDPLTCATAAGYYTLSETAIVDMDAADTVSMQVTISGGAKTVDVYGAGSMYTFFQGYLL